MNLELMNKSKELGYTIYQLSNTDASYVNIYRYLHSFYKFLVALLLKSVCL